MLSVVFQAFDKSDCVQPGVTWSVERMTWRDIGGPRIAEITAKVSNASRAANLTQLAGRPVMVLEDGVPCWWGFVEAVRVVDENGSGLTVDLANMANGVAVEYQTGKPGLWGAGETAFTAWAADSDSAAAYGKKEKLIRNTGLVGSAAAEELRDAYLAKHKNPLVSVLMKRTSARRAYADFADGRNEPAALLLDAPRRTQRGAYKVVLSCRGWVDTLGWRYYSFSEGVIEYDAIGQVQFLGDAAANSKAGQSVAVSTGGWRGEEAWLYLSKVGTPADNIKLELCADSAGSPGAAADSVTVAANDISAEEYNWTKFSLSAFTALVASTTYWLVASRTGANDASNYYKLRVNEALGFSGGALKLFDSGSGEWGARAPNADLNFRFAGMQQTSTQLSKVCLEDAHLAGFIAEDVSGLYKNPYRDGTETGLQVVEDLLAIGSTSERECMLWVDHQRYCWLRNKPDESDVELRWTSRGLEWAVGSKCRLSERLPGAWAEVESDLANAGRFGGVSAGRVYVEAVEWTPFYGLVVV